MSAESSEELHSSGIIFATSFDRFKQSEIADRIHVLDMPYIGREKHSNWTELRRVFLVLKAARKEKVLLLNSSSGRLQPDTMALAILGLLPRAWRPRVALMGEMWQPNSGLRHLLDWVIVHLADRAVDRYFVHSTDEMGEFPRLWGFDKSKMRCCLYFCSVSAPDLAAPEPPRGNHVFAGGNSHRDYEPLIEVARRMPQVPFVFATHLLQNRDLPPNVTAQQVPHAEFIRLMRSSVAVVTPIKKGLQRAAGQQTYLNAMIFRRPSIVNQTFGVHDHITHNVDGLIVDGSAESYVQALNWVLDPKNASAVERMCAEAHRAASERFSHKRHLENAVKLMKDNFGLELEEAQAQLGKQKAAKKAKLAPAQPLTEDSENPRI